MFHDIIARQLMVTEEEEEEEEEEEAVGRGDVWVLAQRELCYATH